MSVGLATATPVLLSSPFLLYTHFLCPEQPQQRYLPEEVGAGGGGVQSEHEGGEGELHKQVASNPPTVAPIVCRVQLSIER